MVAAFGLRVDPARVRIVRGPGHSPLAALAFRNGNPAITVGCTIYIKGDYDVPKNDLTKSEGGLELLLHEFTHVVQYSELGYTNFGVRYAKEMRTYGGAAKLYDYKHRKTDFQHETLEGQAEIVGNYTRAKGATNPQSRAMAAVLERKLQGTGIYGE